jgi:hypothetical protein
MEGDVKEVVGALMRVLGGDEITRGEVEDLEFEADGGLQDALNEAYIQLLEFAYDRDARLNDPKVDGEMRADLERSLNTIVRLSDAAQTIRHNSYP